VKKLFNRSSSETPQSCYNDSALIFTQVKCFEEDSWKFMKRHISLGFACLGLFGCSIYLVIFYYRLLSNYLDFKLWDMKTATVNDFALELKITDEIWDDFIKKEVRLKLLQGNTRAEKFHGYVQSLVEERLNEKSSSPAEGEKN